MIASDTASNMLLTLIATALLTFAIQRLLRVFWHPLSHVPGPVLAAFSSSWLVYHEYFRRENLTDLLTRLHDQYGMQAYSLPSCLKFLIS